MMALPSSPCPILHQFPSLLDRLENCKSMSELKQIHAVVVKNRAPQSQLLLSKLLYFCALSPRGDLDYAHALFHSLHVPSHYIYNTIIRGFSSRQKNLGRTLSLYRKMLDSGYLPDHFTLPFLLKACADSRALEQGAALHAHAAKLALDSDVYVNNTLMRVYAVCGEMDCCQKLFSKSTERDLVSWTTLISGYAKMSDGKQAIRLFLEMGEAELVADELTIVTVLSACSKLGDLELGRKIHRYVEDNRLAVDVFVGNALVDMYLKCGDTEFAYWVFAEMPERNVVSWNALISGLAQQGEFKEALTAFRTMQAEGVEPDNVTLVCVLNSCANLGALELGRWIHAYVQKNSIHEGGFIGNALVDMYAKCGNVSQALEVFAKMKFRDVYSYTAMIVGFAMHGQGEKALRLFSEMSVAGIKPNAVTFVGVLSACSHVGLVEEGRKHFDNMSRLYNLIPQTEHYGCMVDLLGRAGLLEEAEAFVRKMPIQPDAYVWGALLGACQVHKRVELGERIVRKLLELEPDQDGAYVLMSNMYASANRRRDAVKVRKEMKMQKVKKIPGCSMIELGGVVHEFRAGDKSHPKKIEIHMMLDEMVRRAKLGGYVPSSMDVSNDVADEEEEQAMCFHSERLAIALGLISTSPGMPLRVVKNLRVCNDCHTLTKFISKVFSREIVVRDRNRFHHFKEGSCSCLDFW